MDAPGGSEEPPCPSMSPRLTQHRTTEVRRVVATSTEDLRGTVGLLHEAFGRRCEQDGTKSTMRGNWARLFEEMDEDESGRLDSREFVAALVDLEVADEISDDSAEALWRYVDADGSGEVTIKEFQSAVYLLMVEGWPSHDEATLRRSVAALNHAVETRHERKKFYDTEGAPSLSAKKAETRFNWFKMFTMLDADGSGRLGFEELEDVLRKPYPCLATPEQVVSVASLRGLWKAIDADASGDVTVDEFMTFMRSKGPTPDEVAEAAKDAETKRRAAARTARFSTKTLAASQSVPATTARGFSAARAKRWATTKPLTAPADLSLRVLERASRPALRAELEKRRSGHLCGALDAEGFLPFEAGIRRNGPRCVDRCRRRVAGLACEVSVWQHLGHAVLEVVDVAAEGHHRPSLAALADAAAAAASTAAAYHAVGVDLPAEEVARACMRREDAARLYRGLVDAVCFEGDRFAGAAPPGTRRLAVDFPGRKFHLRDNARRA